MRQVLARCLASKAHDFFSKPCFEAFATQQSPKNWRTRKKCNAYF